MAARFTEHQGDPAWLKSQREAQARARAVPTPRQQKAFPLPNQAPTVIVQKASNEQFHDAANLAGNVGFVLGFLAAGAALRKRRRR